MPDDFLAVLKAHRRAPLKIYLGMAAGVGKTVAMLREGKRLSAEGVEVVCAIVETHGRSGTLAEVQGIELVPRKTLLYRNVPLEEMDLEAVLARRPAVALVDELAHTNVGGSKNEKRWQDVEELLDAGISVMATLNIQHLESLHDIVLRASGVTGTIPVDLVTKSASGLDPHISPAAAEIQLPRLARTRNVSEGVVREAIARHTEQSTLGLLGEPRVNVLLVNLELDRLAPYSAPSAPAK